MREPLEAVEVAALRELAARTTKSNGGWVRLLALSFDQQSACVDLEARGLVERGEPGKFVLRLTAAGIDALAAAPA